MSLTAAGTIEIPNSPGSAFDNGAFEPETRCVFIAHTAQNTLEVADVNTSLHIAHVATLRGFPEAAGLVAGKGSVLLDLKGA
jgi:hypothetical protein